MANIALSVRQREQITKGANHSLRREGFVPAVVYHKGDTTVAVAVGVKELARTLGTEAGRNVLINLTVEGATAKGPRMCVIKEIQTHPVSREALHVDFHQIALDEKIKVTVKIKETGEPYGVKTEGGILEFPVRALEVECLPMQIPEFITLDISSLKLNDAIQVKDLALPQGVVALTDKDMVIVKVVPPHVEKAADETTPALTEPELIAKKKTEEGEEGEEGKPADKAAAPAAEKSEKK